MENRIGKVPEGPLRGIRVIDITTQITGPLCSQGLGDLGADVIKVEPLFGETARWMAPPQKAGVTGYFSQNNRNKRSLAVDLKTTEGIAIIKQLVATADILVENFRGGVPDRLGIGYDDLQPLNDKLIYVSITGFGRTGPYSHKPAYDMLTQGMVGLMPIQGQRFGGKPQLFQSAMVDKTTANTAQGITLAALYARDGINGTGKGQRVDIPMMDAWAANSLSDLIPVDAFQPSELPDPEGLAVLRSFETTDGYVVGMCLQDAHFQAFCESLDCTELLEKPGNRNVGERIADFDPWLDDVAGQIARYSTHEFLAKMEQAAVPFGPVQSVREFAQDPQVKHNGTLFDVEHPEAGIMRFIRYPGHLSATPACLHRFPPRLGEHNSELLVELGYDDEAIASLRGSGVIS